MSSGTDGLIERLAAAAEPVRRLRPPVLRAGVWLSVVTAGPAAGGAPFADVTIFARRAADAKLALELAGTALTGILAVIAAFELSLPDRSAHWALLPLPSLGLWIASRGHRFWW